MSALPGLPDLFGRVALHPLEWSDVVVSSRRAVGHLDLDEVFDLEPARAQEPDHLAVGESELDPIDLPVLVVPLCAVHPEEVAVELELGWGFIVVLRVAEQQQRVAPEEDEPTARSEQPGRLRDPAVRIAPDGGAILGEGEVEALVPERRTLGVRVHEREP